MGKPAETKQEVIKPIYTLKEPLKGTKFNEKHMQNITEALARNDGYCPCVVERNEDTLCQCKEYRETLECHCNLYIKE